MRVAILGCGYVGIELGRRLLTDGHDVAGVRRSTAGLESVAEAGVTPIRGDVTDPDSLASVSDVDALVYAASPADGGGVRTIYLEGLRTVIDTFADRPSPPDRLVLTSSTSVYGDHEGAWVDETTAIRPDTERATILARGEGLVLDGPFDGTVVRLAGLYGPERYRLDRYLEGPVTAGVLNMIHRDDAAGTIEFLLEEDHGRGEVVLAVDDEPVDKWRFADWLAEAAGVAPPQKVTLGERLQEENLPPDRRRRLAATKRCRNRKLRSLGYRLEYPTFREGYRAAIDGIKAG